MYVTVHTKDVCAPWNSSCSGHRVAMAARVRLKLVRLRDCVTTMWSSCPVSRVLQLQGRFSKKAVS